MGKNPANLKSSMRSAQYFTLPSWPGFPQACEQLSLLPLQDFLQGKHPEPSGAHFRGPHFFFLFFYSFLPVSDWPLSLLTFLPFLPACPGQTPPEGEAEGGNQATHGSPLGEQCRFLLGSWSRRGRRESPCRCVQSCQPVVRGKRGAVILSVSRSL